MSLYRYNFATQNTAILCCINFFPQPYYILYIQSLCIVLSPLWFVRASVVPFRCSDPVYTLITIVVVIVFGYMFCSLLEYVGHFQNSQIKRVALCLFLACPS